MNLFESNFMRRARYLTEDKRALLLDTMQKMNHECWRLYADYENAKDTPQKRRLETDFNTEIEKGVLTAYLLLDSPVERTAIQVEKRISTLEHIKKEENCTSLYAASYYKYVRKDSEIGIELEDAFGLAEYELTLSGEGIPSSHQKEYHEQMMNYMKIPAVERERFIREVCHPYSTHKPRRYVKMGREDRD